MVKVNATPKFMRMAKKVMKQETLQELIDTLAIDPLQGVLIQNTGGIRKLRWKTGKGVGKRGGLRILYYFDGKQLVLLITIFKKSDQENIDESEKVELRKLIKSLFGG